MGPPVIAWLVEDGWTVYQEVDGGPGVADVVAVRGLLVHVVELKRSLSLDVIAQAARWRDYAHHVHVAVPVPPQTTVDRRFARQVLEWQGIGMVYVAAPGRDWTGRDQLPPDVLREIAAGRVEQKLAPALLRRPPLADMLRGKLRPEHATYAAAGSTGGRRWSPFVETCHQVVALVAKQPGIHLRAAIDGVRHHYSSSASARASLAHWIGQGKVDGVRLVQQGKALTLWPPGVDPPAAPLPCPPAQLRLP